MAKKKRPDDWMDYCFFTEGVDCAQLNRKCEKCGFKPSVSRQRIAEKYGEKYTELISDPVTKG